MFEDFKEKVARKQQHDFERALLERAVLSKNSVKVVSHSGMYQ